MGRVKEKDFNVDEMIAYNEMLLTISKQIIEYRRKNNLTQRQFAELVGCTQVMVSKLEKGNYNPTLKFINELSWKISNSIDFFTSTMNKIINNLDIVYGKIIDSEFNAKDTIMYSCYTKICKGDDYNEKNSNKSSYADAG